jgi:hypothetical protein
MMPRRMHYILDARGEPVEEPDFMKWALWMNEHDPLVARVRIGQAEVSTVFLGLNHGFMDREGLPILWETMVFGGPLDEAMAEAPESFKPRQRAF